MKGCPCDTAFGEASSRTQALFAVALLDAAIIGAFAVSLSALTPSVTSWA